MKGRNKSRSVSRKNASIRQRIVDAARAHFFSHGFRNVTMDDLAEELGISKTTLYAHFPGKIDLLESVLADKFQGVETMLKAVTRAQPHDFPATLRELLENRAVVHRSEEHTSELQSLAYLVCRLLLEKKNIA